MRDFRGRCKFTGKWVFGDFVRGVDKHQGMMFIWVEDKNAPLGTDEYCVVPETVGQYTGIYTTEETEGGDTQCVFIYEGDIVDAVLTDGIHEDFSWGRHVVVFDRGAFCLKDRRGLTTPMCSYSASVKFKVLGNVWDNPELMEGHSNA